ncbi:4-diphosphocytidyl-2C-methyl-D-erythritol synthase [Calothrix sp. HK-06]|nr:4-diphosphocytidyl-2C-methyl-D-erythritol synthase [Calothrix sp. HK-06]
MKNLVQVGIVILAAGASTRMGTPKQLLKFQGRSFLRHTIEIALASVCKAVIVVLGANALQIRDEVSELPVVIVENHNWHQGMGGSIQAGIKTLEHDSNIDGAILLLCDQPFISVDIINKLVEAFYTTEKSIIASEYKQTLGVPALFARHIFAELMNLNTASGAKQVIQKNEKLVHKVFFELGAIDIDTLEEYEQLNI